MSGRCSAGNRTSTTGPMIWVIRPVVATTPAVTPELSAVRIMVVDVRLAHLVVSQGQAVDEVLGVIGCIAHGHHLRAEERRRRLEHGLVDEDLDTAWQKLLENGLWIGLENVVELAGARLAR